MDDWLEAAYEDRQSGTDPDDLHDLLGTFGWDASSYGDTIVCSCGEELELDAPFCSCGMENPLVKGGYI